VPRPRTLFRVLTLSGFALVVLALPAASGATTFHHAFGAHTTQVATDPSRLQAGEILLDGSALVSASGRYRSPCSPTGTSCSTGRATPSGTPAQEAMPRTTS